MRKEWECYVFGKHAFEWTLYFIHDLLDIPFDWTLFQTCSDVGIPFLEMDLKFTSPHMLEFKLIYFLLGEAARV